MSSVPLIVTWTRFGAFSTEKVFHETMVNCPYKCDVVEREDMKYGRVPNAYIIHGKEINMSDLPNRFPHQLVVYFMLEAPTNARIDLLQVSPDYFNASISYHKDATYRFPYGKFERQDGSEDRSRVVSREELLTALPNKTNGVLIIVSHCYTHSHREAIIRNISEVINITIAGECNELFPNATRKVVCPHFNNCEGELVATHRFYLSFENSDCNDYITEKFFNRISGLLIPIVKNRSAYSGEDIPQDSFLAISDYSNLKDMANHIDFLMRNDSAYLEYFEWTKVYRKPVTVVKNVSCDLCADLHTKKKISIKSIKEHYFVNQCDV